jgi:hypothetical protein
VLDGEEDDAEEDADEEDDAEEDADDEDEDYAALEDDAMDASKKGRGHRQFADRGQLGRSESSSAKQHVSKKAKEAKWKAEATWKAAKAEVEGGAAVIMRLDDSDDAARETFRRAKEAHDRLPPNDDDEHSQDKANYRAQT